MKTIQYHIRKSYYEKLHILMENFPHNYKREFKFVDQRLIQPRLRRMNENREFAKEPLPKNLPFTQIEPKFDFNIEMTPERVDQYQKLLRYHGFQDMKGRYQHSAFLESLIFRAYEKLEKEKPEVASKTAKPLIKVTLTPWHSPWGIVTMTRTGWEISYEQKEDFFKTYRKRKILFREGASGINC